MTEKALSRVAELTSAVEDLVRLADQIGDAKREILLFAGASALMGSRIADGRAVTTALRRFEVVIVPETLTLLNHIDGILRSGLRPPDLDEVRRLVDKRARSLLSSLMSSEENALIRIEPDVDLRMSDWSIDARKAIETFLRRSGAELEAPDAGAPGGEGVNDLFVDYLSRDLPREEADRIATTIAASPVLKRHEHDDLIALTKLRSIVLRVDGYGYGVSPHLRAYFRSSRRNVLWAAPRIGHVMAAQVPTWRRHAAAISRLLLNLRRYDGHMRDLSKVPDDDDWFDGRDPLIIAVRQDAMRIHQAGVEIVAAIGQGPSRHRFEADFFQILPFGAQNYTGRFLEAMTPLQNAMAVGGVGGRAEKDLALAPPEEKPRPSGLRSAISSLVGWS